DQGGAVAPQLDLGRPDGHLGSPRGQRPASRRRTIGKYEACHALVEAADSPFRPRGPILDETQRKGRREPSQMTEGMPTSELELDRAAHPAPLVDPFGRAISYLRVSVTDRCDFRCVYCMSENMSFLPKADILSLEELDRLCSAFVARGVRKLRLT